jgi:predicted metalloprotease with PDZ domain
LAAPFIDSAVHRQQTNLSNTSITYYIKGELIGVVMDLLVRGRTNGARSLDDVFLQMYDEHYLKAANATYYLKGRGYTEQDFVRALSRVAGADMQGFYDRHIRGVELLPYESAFSVVGLRLVKTPNERVFTGLVVERGGAGVRLAALPTAGPAARAGLQQGDQLVAVNGSLVNRSNWQARCGVDCRGARELCVPSGGTAERFRGGPSPACGVAGGEVEWAHESRGSRKR